MLNKVILIGNLTRDVELRYAQSGTAIGKFGIAVNRNWRDKSSGENREETMFIDVSVFGRSAEIANQYLSKGRRVMVEGRLVLEQWTDQNGQKRSRHSVAADNLQFLDSKGEGATASVERYSDESAGGGATASGERYPDKSSGGGSTPSRAQSGADYVINDDEIPF